MENFPLDGTGARKSFPLEKFPATIALWNRIRCRAALQHRYSDLRGGVTVTWHSIVDSIAL
jgi:hypothetical protein